MISIENLSYEFPQKDLYHNVSFTIEDGQHCAFIGSNGTGKSTLVNMIMKPDDYLFDGKIIRSLECRIGYVRQFFDADKTCESTVFEYLSEQFIVTQQKIDQICADMATATDLEPLMEQYQNIYDAFQAMDGDNYESNIRKELKTAGLETLSELKIDQLSGGEFKLVQIMKEMLLQPDLLIMDEPDVFLDFERLNSLKNLINGYKGTILVITHNRYLLNHCFNKILHLENTEIQEFEGNYTEYNLMLLQTKIEIQELAAKDTEEIERNQKLVDKLGVSASKFANATLGRSLKARKSILERLEARRVKAPFVEIRRPEIEFHTTKNEIGSTEVEGSQMENQQESVLKEMASAVETASTTLISVENYSVAFDEVLLTDVNFEIGATDKIAIVGPNGTGKTTLLKEIYQHKSPLIQISPDVDMAYLSQLETDLFDMNESVADVLERIGLQTKDQMSDYLAKFCFNQEVLTAKVKELSGGEKNLLQIAIIAAGDANVLLLDEPTSHLDTYSQIELENAIKEYNGAILMVSHDFYTIANCMDYVLFIEDKSIRKISIRKFRKMIYDKYFDKDYLEYEQKKKEIETQIAVALEKSDYETAATLSESLEKIIHK